jgi:hypothetical protein
MKFGSVSASVTALVMLFGACLVPASAATITWTLSSNVPLSDGGTLNGYFGIYDNSGFVNGNPFDLTTAGGTTNYSQHYTATINASDPNSVTVQFFAPNPAYSSTLQLTFLYSLLVPVANNPLVGGIGGPSYECEGWSCTEADTRFVTDGFASAFGLANGPATTPLPAALPLFASGLGGLGFLQWRRKKKAAAAALAA